jgi:hypothetical protein
MNDTLKRALLLGMAAAALGVNSTTQAASCYRCCVLTYGECVSCGCWVSVSSGVQACSPGQNCGDNCGLCGDNSCGGGWTGQCDIT